MTKNSNNNTNTNNNYEESFEREKAAAEEGRANALMFVNTLHQIVERQNELSRKVQSLEQELSHLKINGGGQISQP